jgi:ubiquinone/menaquinone biosynthesis C-methylase UbiE
MNENKDKPDYGIDGGPLNKLVIVDLIFWGTAVFLITFPNFYLKAAAIILFICGLMLGFLIISMNFYTKAGKLIHRDKLLSMIDWKGNEMVLDIGTGRGLLMIGAAKRLNTGKSIGIDIWRQEDMQDNTHQNTLKNGSIEGVLDKIEIKNVDAQKMDFNDNYFDVILSNLCLHNIPSKQGRDAACREIVRVLKPGGTVIISDILYTKEYGKIFLQEGLSVKFLNSIFLNGANPGHKVVKAFKKISNHQE